VIFFYFSTTVILLTLLIDDCGKMNWTLLNVINSQKYCHKSIGIGIDNTLCQRIVIGIGNSFYTSIVNIPAFQWDDHIHNIIITVNLYCIYNCWWFGLLFIVIWLQFCHGIFSLIIISMYAFLFICIYCSKKENLHITVLKVKKMKMKL